MGACWQAIEDVTIARKRAPTSRPVKLIWNVTWNKQRIRGGAGSEDVEGDAGEHERGVLGFRQAAKLGLRRQRSLVWVRCARR